MHSVRANLPKSFKARLDEALTAKQELEAKVAVLEEQIIELKAGQVRTGTPLYKTALKCVNIKGGGLNMHDIHTTCSAGQSTL